MALLLYFPTIEIYLDLYSLSWVRINYPVFASQVISKDLLINDHQKKPGNPFKSFTRKLKPVPVERHCKTCQYLTWEVFSPSVPHQQQPSLLLPGHSLHQSYQNSPTPPQSTAVTRSRRHRFHPPRLNLHSQPSRQNVSSQTDQIFSSNYWKQTLTVMVGFSQLCLNASHFSRRHPKHLLRDRHWNMAKPHKAYFPPQKNPEKLLISSKIALICNVFWLIFREHICFLKSRVSPGLGCHCECLHSPPAQEIAHDSHMVHH